MSSNPSMTQPLADLVDAFTQTADAVLELARDCSDDDLAQETDCPGWTVHDQISHVAGVEAWLEGHKDPRVELPPYAHVRNDLGKRVEQAVEVRRRRTGNEVLTELETVLAERHSTLRSPGLTATTIIDGVFGPDEATTVVTIRAFDIWVHEQDIRSALGRPGNLDSAAARLFVNAVMRQLPRLISKDAGLEPGQVVVIEVTGPLPARQAVLVEVDDDGRPRGRALGSGETPAQQSEGDHDGPTTIRLSTEAFTRRAAGRRAASDTEYDVVGDEAIADRVMEALVVTH